MAGRPCSAANCCPGPHQVRAFTAPCITPSPLGGISAQQSLTRSTPPPFSSHPLSSPTPMSFPRSSTQ